MNKTDMRKHGTIYYFCPDIEIQSAGIRRIYRHVDFLNQAGFKAQILHQRSGFRPGDLTAVPVSYLDRESFSPDDIIVIPEGCPTIMSALRHHTVRRFAIALNWDYVFKHLPPGTDWRSYNIERVLTVSPAIAEMISWSMGLPTHVLASSINHRLYYMDAGLKRPHIVYITRKCDHVDILKRLLRARNPEYVSKIEWFGLHDLPEAQYAARIREASVFLNLSGAEGYPTSCLEAMASGTLVASYESLAGKELLHGSGPEQNCLLAPVGDYVSMAYALEPVLKTLLNGQPANFKAILSNASKTACELKTENEAETLIRFWRDTCAGETKSGNRPDQANNCRRQAHELSPDPDEAQTWYKMGLISCGRKDWTQAIIQFKRAWDLDQDLVNASFHLAVALKENGQYSKAVLICQKTLEKAPHMADGHHLQGICYLAMGAPHNALESIDKAVALEPENADYYFHLAQAHLSLGSLETALACYHKVVRLRPDWEAAHYNLAVALRMADRVEEAIDHAKQAIHINPDYAKAYPLLFRLAQHACDWDLVRTVSKRLDQITRMELDRGLKTTEPPLTNIRRQGDVQANMKVARSWSRYYADATGQLPSHPAFEHQTAASGRIRIGYLSGDFKDHAVAFQVRGMLEKHDRDRFEIFGYACNPDDGTVYRQLLARACDHFRDVHDRSNPDVAQQINADGIHILVDMSGHSRDNRLGVAALRPAPVQVSYLGFLSTTGADFIDYIIADPIVVPQSHAAFYTEKIVYLPHCYQVNDDRMPMAAQSCHRSQWGLPDDAFVFCSFNQPYKIDADLFRVWMNILRDVDHGVLWLVERSAVARENLRLAAQRAKIDPARLIFTGFVPLEQNLARLQLADLVLDTVIYNGGATTANALWAGVPVLSVLGEHWVSRMSASALNAVGLSELVARDDVEYEALAKELALDPKKLEAFRQRLARQRSSAPLFDTALFTRHMERAYTDMWDRHAGDLPPATFQVAP